jgi:hypothetical protein
MGRVQALVAMPGRPGSWTPSVDDWPAVGFSKPLD